MDTDIHLPTGSAMSVTIPAIPQVRNCGFDTAAKVVVTGNIYLSFRPVQLNWMEVQAVGWHPEDLTASIIDYLLHDGNNYFWIVVLQPNNSGDLEFFS